MLLGIRYQTVSRVREAAVATDRSPRPTDEISRRRARHEALAWVTSAWRSEQILRVLEDEPAAVASGEQGSESVPEIA